MSTFNNIWGIHGGRTGDADVLFLKNVTAVGLAVLSCFLCSIAQADQLTGRVTLVCRSGNDIIGYDDTSYYVDFDHKMVGDSPAEITDGDITWTQGTEYYTLRIRINRYTGALRGTVFDQKTKHQVPDIIGTCVRAPERKF